MSTNFFSLPTELRNKIYELVLVSPRPIYPLVRYVFRGVCHSKFRRPHFGLLRVNKRIHNETVRLFYGGNLFDLSVTPRETLGLFLSSLGPINPGLFHSIRVAFPSFRAKRLDDSTLECACLESFMDIQRFCGNVKCVTTSLHTSGSPWVRRMAQEYPETIVKATKEVEAYLTSLFHSARIVVKVHSNDRSRREQYGWTQWSVDGW